MMALYRHDNVHFGAECKISAFSSLENVTLGSHVTIADEVQLKNVVIGDNVKISRRVTFYSDNGGRPLRVGNSCWIGYGVFGEATGGVLDIGDFVAVSHSTTILTSSGPGGPGAFSPIMREFYPVTLGPIRIRPHCWIGAHSVLMPGADLDEGVVIGANSMVPSGKYPAWSVFMGSPIRPVKKLDSAEVERIKARLNISSEYA